MTDRNHIIKKQILDLTLDSDIGSFSFQSRVSDFFKTEILPLIDAHCSSISGSSEIFRLDRLEIDLGVIDPKKLVTDFKNKINKLFPEKLSKAIGIHRLKDSAPISDAGSHEDGRVFVTSQTRDFELLEFFMKEGRLPWWVKEDEFFEITALLEEKVDKEPAKVKKLITGFADNPASVKRLLYHAGKPVLEEIIGLFHPQQYKEICKLSHELVAVFLACPCLAAFSPGNVRLEIWLAVLSQTFVSEGRFFNRQFMAETVVRHLVKIFGADYSALVGYLSNTSRVEDYGVLKQFDIQETATGINDRFGKPWPSETIDYRTSAYLQQLDTIKQLVKELQLILSNGETAPKSLAAPEFTTGLQKITEVIRKISNMILNLLNRAGESSVFSLTATKMDEDLKQYVAEFEELIEKLYSSLEVILDQKAMKADDKIVKKIRKTIESINDLRKKRLPSEKLFETESFADSEEIYLRNAGIVLLWPYLTGFFEAVGLVEEKRFVDDESKERAISLLHCLTFGTGEGREYDLALNKILCGLDPGTPVNPYFEIAQKERDECEDLLQAVVFNWSALKELSVPGLRNMFLQREGMIFTRDGYRVLRAKEEAYDILLDKMPWGIGTIRLPWMEQLLFVEWRI